MPNAYEKQKTPSWVGWDHHRDSNHSYMGKVMAYLLRGATVSYYFLWKYQITWKANVAIHFQSDNPICSACVKYEKCTIYRKHFHRAQK